MATNLDAILQPRRGKLIKRGEPFGSQDTLDQANQTLGASAKHAKALQTAGLGPKRAAGETGGAREAGSAGAKA